MERVQNNKWMIALSVSAGAVMAAIDTFILYVATPHLRGTFSATVAEISWVSTSYAVASMVCMLLSGSLCQRFGRKSAYQMGLCIFIVGSALCAASSNLQFLIVSRIIQGVGAGILLPVEIVLLRRTFPVSQHGLVMGIYGTTVMVGPAIGPLLGGMIIDNAHWSMIFLVNIPIGIIAWAMVQHFVDKDEADPGKAQAVDWPGIFLLILGIFSLIWLLERGDRLYWFAAPSNVALLFVAVSSLAMFCAHELMTPSPVVDLRVLKNPTFSSATLLNCLMGFIVSGTLFILPVYMQELLDFTATKAGTALAPRAVVMMFAFPLVGMLFNHVPAKRLILTGLLLGFYSAVLMTMFTHESGWHDLVLPQILQGIAVALVLTPLSTVALIRVAPEKLAASAGFDAMSRQIGSSLGIAVFASLLTHYQLSSWGVMRHSVSLADPLLNDRFEGVIEFFMTKTSSTFWAIEKSTALLFGRVEQQVLAITYMNIFQVIAMIFLGMVVVATFTRLKYEKSAS